MRAPTSEPPRRASDTHVMPVGDMMRRALEGQRKVRCPACVMPCAKADEGDEPCPECEGVRMITREQADEWLLRNCVPGSER